MTYKTYTIEDSENVKLLLATNTLSDVVKMTGINRGTIRHWISNNFIPKKKSYIVDCPEYSFILGFYLGDGYITKMSRTQLLNLYNDMRYENINVYIENCLQTIFPENKVNRINHSGSWRITVHNKSLPEMFPQHGVGKKHDRIIELVDWQKDIIEKYPNEFIKGLIYSDGCIVYSGKYKRYEFSNRSLDIHNILTYALELIEVEKTSTRRKSHNPSSEYYNQYITTISKTGEIDKLSSFIPDKS